MADFLAGLILGGIVGVLFDRLWKRVEEKPRIRIAPGYFDSDGIGEGYSFTIRNTGLSPIPPFEVVLFRNKRGPLCIFGPKMTKDLLPTQNITFRTPLRGWRDATDFTRSRLKHSLDKTDPEPLDGAFTLRLQVANSDTILPERLKAGNAFADRFYSKLTGTDPSPNSSRIFWEGDDTSTWWQRMRYRRVRCRELAKFKEARKGQQD